MIYNLCAGGADGDDAHPLKTTAVTHSSWVLVDFADVKKATRNTKEAAGKDLMSEIKSSSGWEWTVCFILLD